jgi:hypothetical protein
VLEIGFIFAFIGRQLGRVLTLAFNWATIVLFGRVRKDRQLFLSGMALTALVWPIVLAGIAFPSFATFLFGFVTVPDFAKPWVRLAMLVLAVLLPLANGALSTRLPDEGSRPKGRALVTTILRGYPNALALFIVLVWMMVVAPLGRIRGLFKRWETVHVPIAVKPGAYDTVVRDVSKEFLDRGRAGIEKSLAKFVEKGKLDAGARDATLKRLTFTTTVADLKGVDVVIEAITEDLELKNALFKELDGLCGQGTIFASNTSSLTIAEMAAATKRADRFVGLHFFNPVPLMPLVEVVRTVTTSDESFKRAFAFAKSLGKEAVAAKDNSLVMAGDSAEASSIGREMQSVGRPTQILRKKHCPAEVFQKRSFSRTLVEGFRSRLRL